MSYTEILAGFLREWGMLAVPASIIVSILVALSGVLPSLFVTGANIMLFGPLNGFLISWAGEVIGAAITFYLYRLGFKKASEKLADKYAILENIINSEGREAGWLVFTARLLPFVPSGIITFAASISKIGITMFSIATALGKLPSLALEALVSYDMINIVSNWLRLAMTLTGVLAVYLILKRKKSTREAENSRNSANSNK